MSVLSRVAFVGQQRLDLSHVAAMESFAAHDMRMLISSFTGVDKPYILRGYEVTAKTGLTVNIKVADGLVYNPADANGSFYAGQSDDSEVPVTLLANQANVFVEAAFINQSAVPVTAGLWDPLSLSTDDTSGSEFTSSINFENRLVLKITVNTVGFSSDAIPLFRATTSSSTITDMTDCRPLMFRLGTGGSNPDAGHKFPFAASRAESVLSGPGVGEAVDSPWRSRDAAGAINDKALKSFKDWADAVMTRIAEVSGSPIWYDSGSSVAPVTGASVSQLFFDTIGHSMQPDQVAHFGWTDPGSGLRLVGLGASGIPPFADGLVQWKSNYSGLDWHLGDAFLSASNRNYGSLDFESPVPADGGNVYLKLEREVPKGSGNAVSWADNTSELAFPASNAVSGVVGDFTGIAIGDYVRKESEGYSRYYRVTGFSDGGTPVYTPNLVADATIIALQVENINDPAGVIDSGASTEPLKYFRRNYSSADLFADTVLDEHLLQDVNYYWLGRRRGNLFVMRSGDVLNEFGKFINGNKEIQGDFKLTNRALESILFVSDTVLGVVDTDVANFFYDKTNGIAGIRTFLIGDNIISLTTPEDVDFLPNLGAHTVTIGSGLSTVLIPGDLIIQGNTVSAQVTTVQSEDKVITLGIGNLLDGGFGSGIEVADNSINGDDLTTVSTSPDVVIELASAPGYVLGDVIGVSTADSVGGIPAGQIAGEYEIVAVLAAPGEATISGSTLTVRTASNATSSVNNQPTLTTKSFKSEWSIKVANSSGSPTGITSWAFQVKNVATVPTITPVANYGIVPTAHSANMQSTRIPFVDNDNAGPAGADTTLNFTNDFTWDDATKTLTVNGSINNSQVSDLEGRLERLQIEEHLTDADKVNITQANYLLSDGALITQELISLMMDFTGAVIDFTTGVITEEDEITPLGLDFTPFAVPVGEYFWYGIGMLPNLITGLNEVSTQIQVTPALTSDVSQAAAPLPLIIGGKKLGAVQVYNNAGNIEVVAIRRLGVGSGSGGGQGLVKANYYDPTSTVLPTIGPVIIDGATILPDDLVLFTNLTTNNNRIYKAVDAGGGNLSWLVERPFLNSSETPFAGDSVRITSGDLFNGQIVYYDDAGDWTINDVIRLFDGPNGMDFVEVGSIKTKSLLDNVTDQEVFAVNYTGSENWIINYSVVRGTTKETGQLYMTLNGTDVALTTSNAYISSTGVTFSAEIDGSDVRINYSTTNTGVGGTMKFFVMRWSDSPGGPTGLPNYSSGGSLTPAAGTTGDVQFKGSGGNLDADPAFKWSSSEQSILLDGLFIGALVGPTILNDNTTNAPVILIPVAYQWAVIEYSLERDGDTQVGRLLVTNNGTTASIGDDFVGTAALGVSFTADISGGNMRVRYTTTATGFNASFQYSVRKWQ